MKVWTWDEGAPSCSFVYSLLPPRCCQVVSTAMERGRLTRLIDEANSKGNKEEVAK